MSNLKIGIIIGSTRPGRVGPQVGEWVKANAKAEGVEFELVDLKDFALPVLDEAVPAGYGQYQNAHTQAWAARVGEFDGYIFVAAEYNHSITGALKNAIDFVGPEWNNKAAGIVSYGSIGGARAAEHLRGILGELQIADVRQQVMFSLFTDFTWNEDGSATFTPADMKAGELEVQVGQVVAWTRALRSMREGAEQIAA